MSAEEFPSWGNYLPSQLDPVARALAAGQGEPEEHRRYHALASQVIPALSALQEIAAEQASAETTVSGVVVDFIGSPPDRWHRWAIRPDEAAATNVVRTLLPRVHAVRVHRGQCGGTEPAA